MKLSTYSLNQINNEKSKNIDGKKDIKLPPLKEGEIYNAKLTSVDGDKISISINGKEYTGKVDPASLKGKTLGDNIEFTISKNGSELFINIKAELDVSNTKKTDNILLNLNLARTHENMSILNILKEYKIPITKENFEEFKSLIKSKDLMISILSKNIESEPKSIDLSKIVSKELTLKENLVNIFRAESSGLNRESSSHNTKSESLIRDDLINFASKIPDKSISLSGLNNEIEESSNRENINVKDVFHNKENLDSSKLLLEKNTSELAKEISKIGKNDILTFDNTGDLDGVKAVIKLQDAIEVKDNQADLKSQKHDFEGLVKIIETLKNIDESTFAFNKEMQIPNVVKNLSGFDNLINMKDSLVNQLKNVLDAAFENMDDKAKLTAILKELVDIKSDDFQKLELFLKKTEDALKSQKTEFAENLKEDISILKDSLDYIKEINNQVVYIQTPIDINGEIRDFEMGIKKSKNSKDGSFKIFISLDTKNIGLVQSLIKIIDKEIDIVFKVEEEFEEYFEDNEEFMEKELSSLGYTKIKLSNLVREAKLNLTDLLKNDLVEDRGFDFLI